MYTVGACALTPLSMAIVCRVGWRGTPQAEHSILRGHTENVEQLAWHPSQKDTLATISSDKTVHIWDARSAWAAVTHPPVVVPCLTCGCRCGLPRPPPPPPLSSTAAASKAVHKIQTAGRNINIAWSQDGECLAVGNTGVTSKVGGALQDCHAG